MVAKRRTSKRSSPPKGNHRHAEGFGDLPAGKVRARMALAGLALLALALAAAVTYTALPLRGAGELWQGLGIEMVGGREPGMSVSLRGEAPPWFIASVSVLQDLGVAAIAFPGFLWAIHRYHDRDNLVMRRLRRLEDKAREHRDFARRWGAIGIFAFMLVPFLVNGPLFGAILGRIAGLPARLVVWPVAAATAVNAFAWAYLYDTLFAVAAKMHPALPPVITGAILALLVGYNLWSEWRASQNGKAGGGS